MTVHHGCFHLCVPGMIARLVSHQATTSTHYRYVFFLLMFGMLDCSRGTLCASRGTLRAMLTRSQHSIPHVFNGFATYSSMC